jgi:hypothetical protein
MRVATGGQWDATTTLSGLALDGKDIYDAVMNDLPSPHSELLVNADYVTGEGALILPNGYKILKSSTSYEVMSVWDEVSQNDNQSLPTATCPTPTAFVDSHDDDISANVENLVATGNALENELIATTTDHDDSTAISFVSYVGVGGVALLALVAWRRRHSQSMYVSIPM